MRICYVVHQFLPRYFTGTEQYVFAVSSEMARRGHDVSIFTLDPQFGPAGSPYESGESDVDGLPTTRVRFWQRLERDLIRLEYRHPHMGLRFGQHLDREQPDVVHFFHLRFLGANLIDETRRRGIRSVVHLMDFWFLCPAVILTMRDGSLCDGPPRGGLGCLDCVDPELEDAARRLELHEPMARLCAAKPRPTRAGASVPSRIAAVVERAGYLRAQLLSADCIIAPSRFLRAVFARNGVAPDRIEVMPYGIDASRLQVGAPDGSIGKASSAPSLQPDGPLTFGFIGSIAHHKGLHVLVEAFTRLRGDARLNIYGRSEDFAAYAAPLLRAAEADGRIAFRGPFQRGELGKVLAELAVVVVPSLWYENTPFVVLEAFAGAVPVVASDLGGIAEIVQHEQNGELFARGDPDALGRCLQRLVDEPRRLTAYRAAIEPVLTLVAAADAMEQRYATLGS